MMKYYLCLDVGTTKIKAGIDDEFGNLIAVADKHIEISMPQIGYCEMDMYEIWKHVCDVLIELRTKAKEYWKDIEAIGISAQGEGAWLLDSNKEPVRPAILWNDTRANTIDKDLWDKIQTYNRNNHITPLCVGSYLAILPWMKIYEPENYEKIEHISRCKDWLNYKLTGELCTDITDASTAAFNIFNKLYDREVFKMLDIEDKFDNLPKVFESNEVVGSTTDGIEDLLGIKTGTKVIAGALDVAAVQAGLGVIRPGHKGSILGTTLANVVILSEAQAKAYEFSEGSLLCHVQHKAYLRQVAALSGSVILDWCRSQIANNIPFGDMEQMANSIDIGAEGLIFLPYLFGERAPFKAPEATAGFYGIRYNHNKKHMIRAVYESLAYSLYDCYQYLPDSNKGLFIAGGASNSNFLCQIISDILGEEVYKTDKKELGLFGIYKLLSSRMENEALVNKIFTPNMENHMIYIKNFERFIDIQNRIIDK